MIQGENILLAILYISILPHYDLCYCFNFLNMNINSLIKFDRRLWRSTTCIGLDFQQKIS